MRYIELLSPARDIECGIAAIDHGADAVYIGARRYGARADAGNGTEDIADLCRYAHQYGARVYVALNTILYDSELEDTRNLAWDLYHSGVDAFIVQDMATLGMDMPPVPLHASTQMDNRTPGNVLTLSSLGFTQVVLARELSLRQIRDIHQTVPGMRLEAFCHGALCVSYSGRCHASQYCFARSANRGECSQFCRLPFTLRDSAGRVVECGPYPLSLKDMNRSDSLEEMMDAGISSFKIEGRLKDVSYVKNVTAYYRQRLDEIFAVRKEYARSSHGMEHFSFSPDPARSFSRGFTDYFLHGRTPSMSSSDTPKSKGVYVGRVKDVRGNCIIVSGTESFSNGDGFSYVGRDGLLSGFRINRAEGNHLYAPSPVGGLAKGMALWRNYDSEWERALSKRTSERRIPSSFRVELADKGFLVTFLAEGEVASSCLFECVHQEAKTDQTDTFRDVFSKLGDTPFSCQGVELVCGGGWFVPRSKLTEWRRSLVKEAAPKPRQEDCHMAAGAKVCLPPSVNYRYNVSNKLARQFYESHGTRIESMSMETSPASPADLTLMTCKYCLRYELGICRKQESARTKVSEPLYLESLDGRRFRLSFDCQKCEMEVHNV